MPIASGAWRIPQWCVRVEGCPLVREGFRVIFEINLCCLMSGSLGNAVATQTIKGLIAGWRSGP
ncbi:hypothetical protein GCM10022221_10230 [Actinocorallia aurea]